MIIDLSTAVGTQNLWKQERILIKVTNTAGASVGMWTNLHGSYGSPLAIYTTPSSGVLYIDVTDYVRTYPSTITTISIYSDTQHDLAVSVVGLINPAGIPIPPHIMGDDGVLIVPPSMILLTFDEHDPTQTEFFNPTATEYYTLNRGGVAGNPISRFDGRYDYMVISKKVGWDYVPVFTARYYRMQCDHEYALVRWVSVTGITRISWWEVCKQKVSAVDSYSLLPIDNEYIQIKGREDSFSLRLENLSAYDLWYYSDILTSSKVEISFDGGTTYDRVEVTEKSASIPDGDAFNGKLDVNVNYKRYDAVAL